MIATRTRGPIGESLNLGQVNIHGTPTNTRIPRPETANKAQPVAVDQAIRRLVDDLLDTMYAAPGIGLAATQVNVHERVLVIDVSDSRKEPRVFIIPELVVQEGVEESEEGCLSVPGVYDKVTRARNIRVRALDREGNPSNSWLTGCLQSASSTRWIISKASSLWTICRN